MPASRAESERSREKALKRALKELEENCLVDIKEGLETLTIYIDNIISNPRDQRFRRIRVSNVNYQERLGHLKGGQSLLETIGFREEKQFLVLPEDLYRDDQNEVKIIAKVVSKQREVAIQKFTDVPERATNDTKWTSVTHCASHGEIGERPYMEDDHIAVDNFCESDTTAFFGVYDGHGGRQTVDFVIRSFHRNLAHHLLQHPDDPLDTVLNQCYRKTDAQIRRAEILQSGATTVTSLLRIENGKKALYTANCGDSRAVLFRDGRGFRLSRDHKPSDTDEEARVVASGGFIGRYGRVNGILAVSRALGDHMLKPAVSGDPTVIRHELGPNDKFMISACDGIWDVMSDHEACEFVARQMTERLGDSPPPEETANNVKDATKDKEDSDANANEKKSDGDSSPTTPKDESKDKDESPSSGGDASTSAPPKEESESSQLPKVPCPNFSVEHVRTHLQPVCEALVKLALDKRTLDNVTAMIVWF